MDLQSYVGMRVFVTGASEGIGCYVANHFVRLGADVAICARSPATLQEVYGGLRSIANKNQSILKFNIDVSDPSNVQNVVESVVTAWGGIDVVVNNAGVLGPMGRFELNDRAAWAETININLLGSVYVCMSAIPHMGKTKRGKVVQLAGGGATGPDPNFSAYAASKAGVVRFIETIAKELSDRNIDANAVLPGAINTRMNEQRIAAGPQTIGHDLWSKSMQRKKAGGDSVEKCCQLIAFLSTSASDHISGKTISAQWDDWPSFAERLETLKNSDIYTLRRIV